MLIATNLRKPITGVLVALLVLCVSTAATAQQPLGVVATVNQIDISRQALNREMNMVSFKMNRRGRSLQVDQLTPHKAAIRETLISRLLLLQEAENLALSVNESQVGKALGAFQASFNDLQAYAKSLSTMGFTESMLYDRIKDGLTIQALLDQAVLKGTVVTDLQVRTYYDLHAHRFRYPEQVKASHLLVAVAPNAGSEERRKALATIQNLNVRVANGENFAVLAMDHSDCPSKAKGGDLGFFTREQMVPPLAKAAFALSPGEVSGVVQTRFGYHLIRVTERKPSQIMAFVDVQSEIWNRLRREEEQKRIDAYLDSLKKGADIQRYPL